MKSKLITVVFIYLTMFISVYAQTATNISVVDTRDVNTVPIGYRNEAQFEFKSRGALGVPGSGAYSGLLTFAPWGDFTGNKVHQLNFNDGGLYWRTGSQNSTWEGWKTILTTDENGNASIGTTDAGGETFKIYKSSLPTFVLQSSVSRLQIGMATCDYCFANGARSGDAVLRTLGGQNSLVLYMPNDNNNGNSYIAFGDGANNLWFKIFNNRMVRIDGTLKVKKVWVDANVWADDVFSKGYKLMSLQELEKFINAHQHLPSVPTEADVKENGVNVAEMNATLLRKVEELTKYVIEQNKRINALENEKLTTKQ